MRILRIVAILMRKTIFGNNYGNTVSLAINALRTEERSVISGSIKEFRLVMKFKTVTELKEK